MKFTKLFTGLFLLVMSMPSEAMAQNHSAYCQNVDSTAASQLCLTKHLKTAQSRLNGIYEKLSASLDVDGLNDLKDLQKTWLTYRDAECMWETNRTTESGLKRVNELSCMARVTEDRANLLTVAHGDMINPDTQLQLGGLLPWMNAMANEYPDVYWKYGTRMTADLNCDARDEHVMVGLALEDNVPVIQMVIVEDPLVGKAKGTVFSPEADVSDNEDDKLSITDDTKGCHEGLDIRLNEGEIDEETKICGQSLMLTTKDCMPMNIKWTGRSFEAVLENN